MDKIEELKKEIQILKLEKEIEILKREITELKNRPVYTYYYNYKTNDKDYYCQSPPTNNLTYI